MRLAWLISGEQPTLYINRLSIFFWLLDVSLANAPHLYELAHQEQFTRATDAESISLNQIASHPLGKCCESVKFRKVLASSFSLQRSSLRIG